MRLFTLLVLSLCITGSLWAQTSTLFNRSLGGYPITPHMIFQAYIDARMAERSPVPPIWINSQQVRKILYEQLKGEFKRLTYAEIEVFVEELEDQLDKLTLEEQKTQVSEWLTRPDMAGIYKIEEAEKTRDYFDPRYVY